ncbi:uncharacterized protein LOC101851600 isoform X2 [Aplysia californica]|nr:uncharacterized protein LOC101851600 isoform X2 [Aplysia californica]XP_012942402.1 uncharacterized protein LOC101851600 isoform X2 [Aplysia californica]
MVSFRNVVYAISLCGLLTTVYLVSSLAMRETPKATLSVPKLENTTLERLQLSKIRSHFLLWDQYNIPPIGQDKAATSGKYFIYRCDEATMSLCGGWDNRVNGVLLSYIVANLTGRVFKFEHLKPACDLTRYLLPNEVDWHLPKSFHKRVIPSKDVKLIKRVDDNKFLDSLPTMNFEGMSPAEVPYVYFLGNRNYELRLKCSTVYQNQLSWMRHLSRGDIKAAVYKRLFKLSPNLDVKLKNLLAQNLPTAKHRLICAHLRIGANPSNKYDGKIQDINTIGNVWSFVKNHSKTDFDRVFVMSDANAAIEDAKKQSFGHRLILTDGPIVHVDRNRGLTTEHKCAGLEKLIFDQHILMNCDVLMIGSSGISRLAAYIRNTDEGLYCYSSAKGTVEPCTRQDFEKHNFNGGNMSSEDC